MNRKFSAAMALMAAGVMAACATPFGSDPADGPSAAKLKTTSLSSTTLRTDASTPALAVCAKATYDSTAVTIGAAGGTIKLGNHSFVVPARALSRDVSISMVIPGDSTASVRFHPDGLQFNVLAQPVLTLSYKGCTSSSAPSIAYIDEQTTILQRLMTLFLDPGNKEVQSYVQHFSRYAVAW